MHAWKHRSDCTAAIAQQRLHIAQFALPVKDLQVTNIGILPQAKVFSAQQHHAWKEFRNAPAPNPASYQTATYTGRSHVPMLHVRQLQAGKRRVTD